MTKRNIYHYKRLVRLVYRIQNENNEPLICEILYPDFSVRTTYLLITGQLTGQGILFPRTRGKVNRHPKDVKTNK